ncbi:conserved hypothetical protein [Ricinus communis]|uniref:Uncharacterized protein n=1 Tax=Ricinus communis TaxID=3988 RepID=B9R7G3_RICCO|nr:conserved hypothetical protein [Ricinus communis]
MESVKLQTTNTLWKGNGIGPIAATSIAKMKALVALEKTMLEMENIIICIVGILDIGFGFIGKIEFWFAIEGGEVKESCACCGCWKDYDDGGGGSVVAKVKVENM